jgi:hypothetical protein
MNDFSGSADQRPNLSAAAKEFYPSRQPKTSDIIDAHSSEGKPKKTKEQRRCPRRRRPKKKCGSSDLGGGSSVYSNDEFEEEVSSWFDEIRERRAGKAMDVSSPFIELSVVALANDSGFRVRNWIPAQQSLFDADYLAEEEERKKWREWALCAAELERKRRIQAMAELDAEQDQERQARRRWAINAIEQEKYERISAQFLSTLTSTNWFNETITAYHEDYELVCPYYKLGCRVNCRRSTVERHMKTCQFALELCSESPPVTTGSGYEVVCPNSVLGCTYIGSLRDLQAHLGECIFLGLTVQQELEERLLLKQHVIMECEEERARRVRFDGNIPQALYFLVFVIQTHCKDIIIIGPKHPESLSRRDLLDGDMSNESMGAESLGGDMDSSENSDGGTQGRSMFRKKPVLQSVIEEQTRTVVKKLAEEADILWTKATEFRVSRIEVQTKLLDILKDTVRKMWPFIDIRPFGSHATGLSNAHR